MNLQNPSWVPSCRAALVDQRPRRRLEPAPLEERPVVVATEEAGLLALGPTGDGEPGRLGLGAGLVLGLPPEGEPEPAEHARIDRREHVALILREIGGAGDREPAVVLDDPRVVAGREPRRSDALREQQELIEPERAVAAAAWVRRLAARVALGERLHDLPAKLLTQIERHVRDAEPVAGLPRRDHGGGRATHALAPCGLGIDPEPERHPDGSVPGSQQRDRAVDSAAHRDRCPLRARAGPDRRPDRVGQGIRRERLAPDGCRLEQGQPDEVAVEPGRIGGDDPLPVHLEPNRSPLLATRRVSEKLAHRVSVASSRAAEPLTQHETECSDPAELTAPV